ncbi:hypothetical protein [Nannocystis pusilla]|uniref:Uncharacterized protein n=1 Tax=Nannocystis pusilla TaxID=889268 RepID=A0ABS7U509_9BACT|nr:hypothetical protein [Nannocystis pusilla]MBZ5715565.1 hypothetical protein [Nannocystis pusilla]
MLKNLTLIAVTGLFVATGCIINTGTTDSGTDTNITATNNTTDGTSTTDGTDGTSTTDGTDGETGTSTAAPTTTAPTTTGDAPTSTTSDGTTTDDTATTTEDTTAGTTGGAFGKCGWDPSNDYYACGFEGVDPDNLNPIECPDPLPAAGDACDASSPVGGIGCCLPDGKNYYCSDQNMIVIDECGA